MKNSFRILSPLLLLIITLTAQAQVWDQGIRRGMVKVKFKPALTATLSQMKVQRSSAGLTTGISSFDGVANQHAATKMYRLFPDDARNEEKLRKHGLHLWYVVEIDGQTDPRMVVQQFSQLNEVAIAEVDHEKVLAPFSVQSYSPSASTMEALPFNDPLLKDQWHYNNTGQAGSGDADANIFEAWKTVTGAPSIVVAVHDQGVDVNHADLRANIWQNPGEVNGVVGVDDDGNRYIDDINGYNFAKDRGAVDPEYHGTHVAGTVAAVNNNGIGVAGVAGGSGKGDGVKIMSLQILGGAPIEQSYVYAANNGAVISQNSWGYTSPGYSDQAVLDAIDYFIAEAGNFTGSPMKGGLVIFAAGNSNDNGEWYPAIHPGVMAVSSFGPDWKKASYSNYGTWVDIAAPGGDQGASSKGGVLSTIPKNQYAYLQGTSMACPHVSGIAALALANRSKQLTNTELWNKLVTGVGPIDSYNEGFEGLLGSGAIDARLAIQNDAEIAPAAITDLAVTGITQEFATLSWTIPVDDDDVRPYSFTLYYHTEALTAESLNASPRVVIANSSQPGESNAYELTGLLGLTKYYFALVATDRWGNVSALSNVVSETTNEGPALAVDEAESGIELNVDVTTSESGSQTLTIRNNAKGLLRWDHFMRHKSATLAFNASTLRYPVTTATKACCGANVTRRSVRTKELVRATEASPAAFTPVEKRMTSWATDIIGETDLALTNSAAARFYVTESEGFNLTHLEMYLRHDPAKGPVIVEVYKGSAPVPDNLAVAQEYSAWTTQDHMANIPLNEEIFFEQGDTFWVVFHVPAGNLFPLGIGFELDPNDSKNCFMSFDLGTTWAPLEDVIGTEDFAWSVAAASYNAFLGRYLTLEPGSGDVDGFGETSPTLTANAATLINGSYQANVVITSNDAQHRELRVPVTLNVAGHIPQLHFSDIADFGSVFIGDARTLQVVLTNDGFGHFSNVEFAFSDPQFSLSEWVPSQVDARSELVLPIRFSPTTAGNNNATLTMTDGTHTYEMALFGVGAETAEVSITPAIQTINNVHLGDEVTAQVTVENTGKYPLKYFIPGFDKTDISAQWPKAYHRYGYKYRTNQPGDASPLSYEFQDISSTGVDITQQLKEEDQYFPIEFGFDFPYYGEVMKKIFVAQKGFTTFRDDVRPINTPSLGNPYNPRGYISVLGSFLSYLTQGSIHYQSEPDHLIIQYTNVGDGVAPESMTAQMVLWANGDIRFYYDQVGFSVDHQANLTVLIEDVSQSDGILVHNWEHPIALENGMALGFDYPGPNIITQVDNGSGIVAPGTQSVIDITLSTATLAEGLVKRYVNIVTNDPAQPQSFALVELEINSGGTANPVVSIDSVAFGDVFQGDDAATTFTIKNNGTKLITVSDIQFATSNFTITGVLPGDIKPGFFQKYMVTMPTNTLGQFNDTMTISYDDGSTKTLSIMGNVVEAPTIAVDLTAISKTLAFGDTLAIPFSVQNTGLAPMQVAAGGHQWLDLEWAGEAGEPTNVTYAVRQYTDGSYYTWADIRETGTHLPLMDAGTTDGYWQNVPLPFEFEYYGVKHSNLKIGFNGLVSFEEDPAVMFFPDRIPSTVYDGAFIMPYWTFSGFNIQDYPEEEVGIFYQSTPDRFTITWSYLINNFGGRGNPISAQLVLFPNGSMQFLYRIEEGDQDLTSQVSSIGIQRNSQEGVLISDQANVFHGAGLTYFLLPMKQHTVAPSATLSGTINLNARSLFGGTYLDSLTIKTNVPGNKTLFKQVELIVTGDAVFNAPELLDMGAHVFVPDAPQMEVFSKELSVSNTGASPYSITWVQMADGSKGLSWQVWALVDGWFGKEWRWADISELYSPWAWETPTFSVKPGERLKARAIFSPVAAGDFSDEIVLTTNIGERRIMLTASAFEPPAMNVVSDSILVSVTTIDATEQRSIAIDNLEGKSDLHYGVAITYGRISDPLPESVPAAPRSIMTPLAQIAAVATKDAQSLSTYQRTITYTDRTSPDNHAGIGGGAPFPLATAYTAGPDGFNIAAVDVWFRTEEATEGDVTVEIRAGGTSIDNSVSLGSGQFHFESAGNDSQGAWHSISLNQSVAIHPNETFFVIVTYPLGIVRPQGVVNDQPKTPGRYFYQHEGTWYDVQTVESFATSGWLMYVGEQQAKESGWLSLMSKPSDTLSQGATATIELSVSAAAANRGDQIAWVVVSSDDPKQPEVSIPVRLHVNEAPFIIGLQDQYVVAEGDSVTVTLKIDDKEGDSFTLESIASDVAQMTLVDETLTITFEPDFERSGLYDLPFTITDEFGAARNAVVRVEITHTNRGPVFVGGSQAFRNYKKGAFREHVLSDYFSDPDHDALSFTIESADAGRMKAFSSADQFVIQPLSYDSTAITFVVVDANGTSFSGTYYVTVAPNNLPVVSVPLADVETTVKDEPLTIDLSEHFIEVDGDVIQFEVTSAHEEFVQASLSGSKLTLTPKGVGVSSVTIAARDSEGGTTTVTFRVDVSTILGDLTTTESKWEFYPNPVQTKINIRHTCSMPGTVRLLDATGRLQFSLSVDADNHWTSCEMQHLAPGVYVLLLQSGSETEMHRIVKY